MLFLTLLAHFNMTDNFGSNSAINSKLIIKCVLSIERNLWSWLLNGIPLEHNDFTRVTTIVKTLFQLIFFVSTWKKSCCFMNPSYYKTLLWYFENTTFMRQIFMIWYLFFSFHLVTTLLQLIAVNTIHVTSTIRVY